MATRIRLARAVVEALEQRVFLSATLANASSPSPLSASLVQQVVPAATAATTTVDHVIFGNSASETSHGLTSNASQIITGGLNQTARQLLPLSTVGVNGGDLTFTMAVDPVQRNYFTIKLWGSDDTDAGKGRLYLYVPINGVNYEVGYRHEGDYAPLSVTAASPTMVGRFFYSTTLLPLAMTQGKTSITLMIDSTGELYGLGSPSGSSGGNYQFNMDTASRGIYEAYTHTQAMLDVSGEVQGTAPTTTVQTTSEASILGPTGTFTTGLNNWITGKLNADITTFTSTDVEMLTRAYSVSQLSAGYQNAAIISKATAVIDGFATDYFANPTTSVSSSTYGGNGGNEVWGGRFGAIGWAIDQLSSSSVFQSSLDTVVNYGAAGGNQTRRAAWGTMLQASRDYGRFSRDTRYLTNQSLIGDESIYKANRGMEDLGDVNAFSETDAQRYLKESIGLLPWLGSDLPAGGSSLKYGSNYYQVTAAGLTREYGYAGGYSEMANYAAEFYKWTGNTVFRDQAVKMEKAIAYFREPTIDVSGSNDYVAMQRVGLIAWRGVNEADGYFTDQIAYGGAASFGEGIQVAGITLDPTAVGYAKQMLADGQFLANLTADSRFYSGLTFDSRFVMDVYDEYNAVKAAPDSGARLPMTPGQPDFAWCDPQDGVVVIKSGNDRLYLEPYWEAKSGTGVNGLARFYYNNGTYAQYGTMETNPQFVDSDGGYAPRGNLIDMTDQTRFTPPDNPSNAYAGEILPLADAPADASELTMFRGKADYYAFRFGQYLIGLNANNSGAGRSYTLNLPTGTTSATDLISGTTKSGTITVAPGSTVAIKLATTVDATPVPTAPLMVRALGGAGGIAVNWSAASGAATYNVKRSTSADGPFVTIASGLTTTNDTDTSVAGSGAYYYLVTASNANGESYNSMVALSSAGLPSPWTSADVGAITVAGSARVVNGVYNVTAGGNGVSGTADSFHFDYVPVTGDSTIVAHIDGMTNTSVVAAGGVMMRDTLAANSASAWTQISFTGNPRLIYRSTTTSNSTTAGSASGIYAAYWVKLVRSGNTFTSYLSPDGQMWTLLSSKSITMGSTIDVGLATVAVNSTLLNSASYDNVSIQQPPTNVVASASSAYRVGVTWNDNSVGETGYVLERATNAGFSSGLTTWTLPPDTTSYSDTGVAPSTTYYYRVTATFVGAVAGPISAPAVTTPPNAAPTVSVIASATPSPATATTAVLSVLGADDGGEANLVYAWSAATAPANVTFSANGTNAAKSTTATFTKAGMYSFKVTVTDALGLTTVSTVSVNVSFGAFTDSADIGSPALAGSLSYDSTAGAYTIKGNGADIWGTGDQFRFSSAALSGNGSIIARVKSTTNTSSSAKAGVMIRDSAAANAAYAFVWVSPSGAVKFETRASNGVASAYSVSATAAVPAWVKLIRSSNTFAAYYSTDGTTWKQVGTTQTVTMATAAVVGLAVTSHNTASINTAVLDNVSVTAAPVLLSAVSRKKQGTGTYDLSLSLNASSPTIEARTSGSSTIVFNFSESMFASDGALSANEFTLTNGTFSSATLAGSILTLTLSNVVNAARLTVALNGLVDSAGNAITGTSSVVVRNLLGDVDQNGVVNTADSDLVRKASGQRLTALNFLLDLNANGVIDAADIALDKSRAGNTVP